MLVQNWSTIVKNWSGIVPDTLKHFWGTPAQNRFKTKQNKRKSETNHETATCQQTTFCKTLSSQFVLADGTSGRSAKGKIIVHWSSFYQVFFKQLNSTIKKTYFYLVFLYINPSFPWKHTFSFGAVWGVFRRGLSTPLCIYFMYCRSKGLSLRDMLSLGARRMGLGCSGKILLSSSPSSSSSPKGSATF